ncbi:MAG: UDP-N-acetylmuramoyl-L-alanine--D-glutamate ligase [Robiginitomaculum sp.]|nr:UDP-N-acetylmuramoyl-L-alanine--D-glutamate ligase [Robiginitomaculum sp.]
MIPVNEFTGKKVAVFGLGRTGLAAASSLRAGGAHVIGWDSCEEKQKAARDVVDEICDLSRRSMSDLAALVLSPGIAHTFPAPNNIVALAKACDVPIIGDMELLARTLVKIDRDNRPKLVGITGTNGKSTTTALLTHVLQSANLDAICGGNIGRAVLDLPSPRKGQIYVVELSSYQLELTSSLHCDIACLLNLSADHLDRHGGMENYIAAKKRIFARQQSCDQIVIGVDDPQTISIMSELNFAGVPVCAISADTVLSKGVFVVGGKLIDAMDGHSKQVVDLGEAAGLRGHHNWQNAAAVYAMARKLGLNKEKIIDGLLSFNGLAHRMQPLGKLGKVLFVNDSKATNGEAAAKALASFDDIFWIAGGLPKKDGLDPTLPLIGNVRKTYLIGAAARRFSKQLKGLGETVQCDELSVAFQMAVVDANKSNVKQPVVLFSPACASFDQFSDFEERGDAFVGLFANARQKQ